MVECRPLHRHRLGKTERVASVPAATGARAASEASRHRLQKRGTFAAARHF
ncbi:hypothetical protein N177_4141 [Lutibaculum baratangense AMV1]|uniref:Uncharacterized protein n=1 Tax=Lutibaculum baratangense AMV1 TaxID=631454 RepID=V4R8C2_9HYPH|nr:hypothetical protein N177_4141 [Lutibaculum baratangense AMV1]